MVKYRTAILHTNLCDNNPDCPMINLCPQHAVKYDNKTLRIWVDEDLCVVCRKCYDEHCRLFEISENESDYKRIKKKIEDDPCQQSDLQIDRFGADIVDNVYAIEESNWKDGIQQFVQSIHGLSFVEVVIQRESECLYDCIPVADCIDIKTYRKVLVYSETIAEQIRSFFGFLSFPVILVFSNGILVERIWGIYKRSSDTNFLLSKLKKVQIRYKRGMFV